MGYVASACDRVADLEAQIRALLPEGERRERLADEAQGLLARHPRPDDRLAGALRTGHSD